MDCKEFRNIVADLFDKDVDPQIKTECEKHISQCPDCRAYYEDLLMTAELLRPKHSPVSPASHDNGTSRRWLRTAAMFVGVILISGIAFAAYHLMWQSQRPAEEHRAEADSSLFTLHSSLPSSVHFNDVRLDSILAAVSVHYGKAAHFHNEEAKNMKFIMTWEPDASLADFIDRLNMFDGLQITFLRGTIFVDVQEGKEDEQ